MSSIVPRRLLLALIALTALWLRTYDLAARPMHADEANQAVKFGELLESGHYAFDPRDHHGPTLYYAALPIAWIRGERTLAALTETTVRLVPALAGTLSVLLLYLLALPLEVGKAALSRDDAAWKATATSENECLAFAAAAFLAVSPPAVYYSRYFIQETLLVTFTLGAFVCIRQWRRRATAGWAVSAGVCIGLMFATKATAPLFLVAAAIALLPIRPRTISRAASARYRPLETAASRQIFRDATFAFITAVAVAALFYSSFGMHPAGLRDAFRVYSYAAERATAGGSGHEKPWWYYLQLFAWNKSGGLVWHQLPFFALALCGAGLVLVSRIQMHLVRWAFVYTAVVAIVLSVTPYKTPWHAIHFVPGFALLAAGALSALPRRSVAIALAAVIVVTQFSQTRLAAFTRPADPRNPYAYVHSSPDVLKFRALAQAALSRSPDGVVRVISEEYWPLPWYFRGLPRIGYWSTPPADCDGALVIVSADQADTVRARFKNKYRESYLGLRPNFACVVFTPVASDSSFRVH